MNYTLNLPDNYSPPILPGRNKILAALRSGKYKQTKGTLCDGLGYCCLGVICTIQGRLTEKAELRDWFDGDSDVSTGFDVNNPLFPILNDSGFFPDGVTVEKDGLWATSLIKLNDGLKFSFSDIADIIEKVWASEPLSALDIIDESGIFYSNPANRAKNPEGGYVYETEDGRKCAAGRCMIKPPGLNVGGIDVSTNTIGGLRPFTQAVFKIEYRGHNALFWKRLQQWHDNDFHFEDGGISGAGFGALKELKEQYK